MLAIICNELNRQMTADKKPESDMTGNDESAHKLLMIKHRTMTNAEDEKYTDTHTCPHTRMYKKSCKEDCEQRTSETNEAQQRLKSVGSTTWVKERTMTTQDK